MQCRIHLDQFIGGRCRIGRQRVGGPGSGAFGDEHGNDWKILKWRIELMANCIHLQVLECNQLIVGVVVVVDPGVVPINSRGEKQRMHLRDGFLADQLDPIYVAYNM